MNSNDQRRDNVFQNRNFRLVFLGALVSELGAILYSFAVSFYILEISSNNAFLQGLYLALCEGASAMSGISACLGRNSIGYYAMRGLPLNAYDSSMQKIVANQELKDILNILGLDISKSESRKTIDFERILITTDADCYTGDTLVSTEHGLKPIKDLTYDDKVYSSDGNLHDITELLEKKTKVVTVIHAGGGHMIMSPTQKVLVCRDGKIQEVFAKDVKDTDFLLKRKK